MIYIAGFSIALFISALLFNKKNKSKSDIILLLWMILMAIHLYLFYLNYFGELASYLIGIHMPIPLLQAVFLYFYVSSVTNQFPKKRSIALWHLSPAVISYLYLIPFFILPAEQKLEVFANNGKGYETFYTINSMLIYLSGIIYVVWSSLLLRNHKKNIRNQFSDIEYINLKWLQLLIYGIGVIWILVIFTKNGEYIFTGVSIFVILIGFFGIQQKDIFSSKKSIIKNIEVNSIDKDKSTKKEKYATSGLTNKVAEDHYKNLIQKITQKAYYKQNDLSLNDLASNLDIHPNYLSQIINEKEEMTFYDFINTFRVEEFKKLIQIPENKQFTLLALAYDCGFNSKSSFNRYFKKNTGKTPSQFAKMYRE